MSKGGLDEMANTEAVEVSNDTASIYLLFAIATSTQVGRSLAFYMVRYTPRAQADMRALLRVHRVGMCAARIEHMRGTGRVCPAWSGIADLHDAYAVIRHLGDDGGAYDGPYANPDLLDGYAGILDSAGHVDTRQVPEHMTFVLRGKEAARLLRNAHTTPRWCIVTPSTRHICGYTQASDDDSDRDDDAGEDSGVSNTAHAQRTTRIDILGARLDIEDHHVDVSAPDQEAEHSDLPDTKFVLGGGYPAFMADLLTRPDISREIASPTDPAVSEVKRTALHAGDTGDDLYCYIDPRECVGFGSLYSTQQEVDNGGISKEPESLTVVYADVYAWLLRMYNRAASCGSVRSVWIGHEE